MSDKREGGSDERKQGNLFLKDGSKKNKEDRLREGGSKKS